MASLKQAIYAELSGESTITALVSTRIYPVFAPQGVASPYIVYNRIRGDNEHHFSGASNLAAHTYQIEAWGSTPESVDAVGEALREHLDGFQGALGSLVDVRELTLLNMQDLSATSGVNDEVHHYGVAIDFRFAFFQTP